MLQINDKFCATVPVQMGCRGHLEAGQHARAAVQGCHKPLLRTVVAVTCGLLVLLLLSSSADLMPAAQAASASDLSSGSQDAAATGAPPGLAFNIPYAAAACKAALAQVGWRITQCPGIPSPSPTRNTSPPFPFVQLEEALLCEDSRSECPEWAGQGECDNNPGFMRTQCRQACNECAITEQAARRAVLDIVLYALRNALRALQTMPSVKSARLEPMVRDTELALAETWRLALRVHHNNAEPSLQDGPHSFAAIVDAVAALLRTRLRRALLLAGHVHAPLFYFAARPEVGLQLPPELDLSAPAARGALPPASSPVPRLGFGTWMLTGQPCSDTVRQAIAAGFRHFDTAEGYFNENMVS